LGGAGSEAEDGSEAREGEEATGGHGGEEDRYTPRKGDSKDEMQWKGFTPSSRSSLGKKTTLPDLVLRKKTPKT